MILRATCESLIVGNEYHDGHLVPAEPFVHTLWCLTDKVDYNNSAKLRSMYIMDQQSIHVILCRAGRYTQEIKFVDYSIRVY